MYKKSTPLDPLEDGKSELTLINWMGDDLEPVNDARASYDKISTEFSAEDENLLVHLMNSYPPHFSPLRGSVLKFRVRAPLSICRQWLKHIVASNHNDEQLGWNERSFRFTPAKDSGDFYIPKLFLKQHNRNKQASGEPLPKELQDELASLYLKQCNEAHGTYLRLLDAGVSRETARNVLPPAFYTSWVWTCSLQSAFNFIELRDGGGAQIEIVKFAEAMKFLVEPIFPVAFREWSKVRESYRSWVLSRTSGEAS